MEEMLARRRARRQRSLIPVPASSPIPLRTRRSSGRSDHTLSDSDSDSKGSNAFSTRRNNTDLDNLVAHEVQEWRSEVQRSQSSGLRHRSNAGVRALDQSVNTVPHASMSPTHVIIDTSVPTTPTTTTTTLPSRLPSPPPQVSPMHHTNSESTLRPAINAGSTASSEPHINTLPQTSTPASPPRLVRSVAEYSPPSFSSPIPSLSQSYPQELDREQGIELLSPPSSGTTSPFSTFSPFVAPQTLSPYNVVQPLDRPSSKAPERPSSPTSRNASPITNASSSNYQSFASPSAPPSSSPFSSPEPSVSSNLSSPVQVTHNELRSPSPPNELSYLTSPSPVNFGSPHVLSPRSPHSDLSDLDLGSDVDVISEQGSDVSWGGVSSNYGQFPSRR